MPSFLILDWSVVRFIPRRAAAPEGPPRVVSSLARFPDLPIAHAAITPPSTGRMLPVVHRDSSDAK
jgi:hypothetical protein